MIKEIIEHLTDLVESIKHAKTNRTIPLFDCWIQYLLLLTLKNSLEKEKYEGNKSFFEHRRKYYPYNSYFYDIKIWMEQDSLEKRYLHEKYHSYVPTLSEFVKILSEGINSRVGPFGLQLRKSMITCIRYFPNLSLKKILKQLT